MAGGRGGDLAGAKDQSEAAEVNAGQFAKRARSRAAGMKQSPRSPGTGTGRFNECWQGQPDLAVRNCDVGVALIAVLRANRQGLEAAVRRHQAREACLVAASAREGWPPGRGETTGICQRLEAKRNNPAMSSGDTPFVPN